MIRNVSVRGDGVAARCVAHLLRREGFCVTLEAIERPRVPAVMISDPAADLMRDVFGMPELFAGLPAIRSRVVAWGEGAQAKEIPHSAVVISERKLLEALCTARQEDTQGVPEADFTVYTAGVCPAGVAQHRFGSRQATAARVVLRDEADAACCCIESLRDGWLFLIPNGSGDTWLLAIGGGPEELLASSKAIAPRVDLRDAASGAFATCPRVSTPLRGVNWLLCGTAALAFDPICGDGTAQAVREAILAAAVIRGIAEGGNRGHLLSHYETRLLAGMQRHLALCFPYYRSGGRGPWWQAEAEALTDGFRWCGSALQGAPEPRYRLSGFELTPRARLTIN